ncbi:hypothetical protein AGR5A_Cc110057 [Agrobacterium genomosp. 5 str. CFBP 6626]|nr:hypothetical protein AGR5A_Cc110057 [Agrobacterium genomosp. 5 str. CFBP 6626]
MNDRHHHNEKNADHRPCDDDIKGFAAKRLLAACIIAVRSGRKSLKRVGSRSRGIA